MEDPNDIPPYLTRWQPFILGLVANVVHDPAAQVIGLRMLGAWPDVQNPYMLVTTEAGVDGRVKQHYRITVEHASPELEPE